jgi:predicted anti-sigma-YlaC factor YlaD
MHDRFRELISERMDRTLAAAESADLDAHLAQCPGCRTAARDFAAQRTALRGMPSPEPPRDLWARTSAALDRETTRRRLPVSPLRPARGRRAGLATGISVLVVALVVAMPFAPLPGNEVAATPYAITPSELVYAAQSSTGGVEIMRQLVNEVCPAPRADCTSPGTEESVANLDGFAGPSRFVVRPDGQLAVLTGVDASGHLSYEIVVIDGPREAEPVDTSASPGDVSPSDSPSITAEPATDAPSEPPTSEPAPTVPPETAAPETTPPLPSLSESPATASATSPPASLDITPPPSPSGDPGTEATRPILSGVIAAGMPAAWSADGSALAFSAMPADRSAGPDIYIWRPGESSATRVTDDGASHFASWAGSRIVGSRATQPESGRGVGRSSRVNVESFVLDLESGEQRPLRDPRAWLPAVDPTAQHAVAWRGRLAMMSGRVAPVSGRLFLETWADQDPFRDGADKNAGDEGDDGETEEPSPTPTPLPAEASPTSGDARRPLGAPEGVGLASVLEWEVRWAGDGAAFGVWVAERPGARAGRLAVVEITPREIGEPGLQVVVGPERAWRAFSVGTDRVAYVSPDEEDAGELRVATWGEAGSGLVRIRRVSPGEALPAF